MATQKKYTVSGTLSNQAGLPLANIRVAAFEQTLLNVYKALGKPVLSDDKGAYTLVFVDTEFQPLNQGPNLVLRALDESEQLLAESPVYRNAGQNTTINLSFTYISPEDYYALLHPDSWQARADALEELPANAQSTIQQVLNQHLNNRMLALVGAEAGTLGSILQNARLDYRNSQGLSPADFFDQFIAPEARKISILEEKITALRQSVALTRAKSLAQLLDLSAPLPEHPLLGQVLRKTQTRAFGQILGFEAAKISTLIEKDLAWEELGDGSLLSLIKAGTLKPEDRAGLLLLADLARLTGNHLALIRALKTPNVHSAADLLSLDQADWVRILQEQQIRPPKREASLETYAEHLRQNLEQSYPSPYFFKRVVAKAPQAAYPFLDTVEILLPKNEGLIRGNTLDVASLDWSGITAANRTKMEKDLSELILFVNTYRHLGLAALINDRKLDKAKKQSALSSRLTALKRFVDNNPGLDLLHTNFVTQFNTFNWEGIETPNREAIKKQLLAYQRVQALTTRYEDSQMLLQKGLDSATAIARMSQQQFASTSGLPYTSSRAIYRKALEKATHSAHFFEATRNALFGTFNKLRVANQHPLATTLNKTIDGLDDLFGTQNFCDCEHCRSIFGPAAYFTDLMYFVDQQVSKKLFEPQRPNHPLYLKKRRPDLWQLPLTCANTSTEIPYLQVVNEVLEAYIRDSQGVADVELLIHEAQTSTTLPVTLPLEALRLFVGHFNTSLFEVYQTLRRPENQQWQEKLQLSAAELFLITNPNPAQAHARFGNEILVGMEVQRFLQYADISRSELSDLLTGTFEPSIATISVRVEKDSTDIQKYREVLDGLSPQNLDAFHRYLRLWKKTSWSIREFELLLNSLKSAGLLNTLAEKDAAGVPKMLILGKLTLIQDVLKCSPEELAALIFEIPDVSVKEKQKSLWERRFDTKKILEIGLLPADKTQDKVTPLLLAGLGINEVELGILFQLLDIDTTVDQAINKTLLSRLFRQSRIARGLRWSIETYAGALDLVLNGSPALNADQLLTLVDFQEWLQRSPLKIPDLLFVLRGVESSARSFRHDLASSAAAVYKIQKAAESDKKELLLQHLQQTFNLTELQLSEEFLPHLVSTDINDPGIATALNATFTNDQADHPEDFAVLTALLRELERLNLLFERLEFTPEDISFFIQQPAVFGVQNLKNLDLSDTRAAVYYHSLFSNGEDAAGIRSCLLEFQANGTISDAALSTLSKAWEAALASLRSLHTTFTFAPPALAAVQYLQELQQLSTTLGVEGQNLAKLGGNSYQGLSLAREIALGAFTAKYPEEKERLEKLEPYLDKINTLKRDALCAFIIGQKTPLAFEDRAALYAFFLLDTEMSGCFRTSRLVAAITSVQLYVHRCLTNLEQYDEELNPELEALKVLPTWIPQDEWEWRKNYRVWEANRKVFLYPENWIDPALRDTKTPLFKELEDELLQENITKESAEAAYKKYLAQFSELAKLRYAGAYYYRKPADFNFWNLGSKTGKGHLLVKSVFSGEESGGQYYLFARSHTDPYQYYFRTYNPYQEQWGHWTKMELSIEAEEISALMHNGRLYVFWTEVQRRDINNISDGDASSGGSVFKVYTKYAFLDEKGVWSVPQRVSIGYFHVGESLIFQRVLNNVPEPDAEKDKRRDHVYEKFQKILTRKPYAALNYGSRFAPIQLAHIWSQNKEIKEIKYFIHEYTHEIDDFNIGYRGENISVKSQIWVPYTSFTQLNDYFEVQEKTQPAILMIKDLITNDILAEKDINVKVILSTPSTYILEVKEKITVFEKTIPVEASIEVQAQTASVENAVTVSNFDLSLSTNKIVYRTNRDSDITKLDVDITNGAAQYLQKEFQTSDLEEGIFAHYVENGSKSFSSIWRKIIQTKGGEAHLSLQGGNSKQLVIEPLTTILTDQLMDVLNNQGLKQFLSLQTQTLNNPLGHQFDLKGPYGAYYWELFFHIPFLIANHLNANQQFKEAKWWYERIFNPTAAESPSDQGPSDHNWQFREFRNLNVEKLQDILTDGAAIATYRKDPFDPHAIARLRTNAYQKAVVMKYIDNLLDWGDDLFAEDTRESINEAQMLYQLAWDILGERPVQVGTCETADENTLTYAALAEKINAESEILIGLENAGLMFQLDYQNNVKPVVNSKHLATTLHNLNLGTQANSLAQIAKQAARQKLSDDFAGLGTADVATGGVKLAGKGQLGKYSDLVSSIELQEEAKIKWTDAEQLDEGDLTGDTPTPDPAAELIQTGILAFCVPQNSELLAYWDRVEDRMYKIRHCMNISGVRRSLALFQPPIDPGLLVRARAMGLSLEEVYNLSAVSTNLPLYRFEYLIEKAKQFTQTVQSFGGALLSALEKKDGEELTLLRSVQEQNILKLTRELRRNQIKEAQHQYQSTVEAMVNVQNRIDYYQMLVTDGLSYWETSQQLLQHFGNLYMPVAQFYYLISGKLDLIPKIAGFSFSTGGEEAARNAENWGKAIRNDAELSHRMADSAGIIASNERREQDWKFQLTLAEQEKKQLEQQVIAAEIRQRTAEKELEIHEKTIEQAKELHSFFKDKFTNLSLYNFLAGHLSRLYRQAYQIALEMAHKAERAYQFQREDGLSFLGNQHFEVPRAGLLAGERLWLDLQRMEAAYVSNNVREFELSKHISLKLLDPLALLKMKAEGTCTITLHEWLFDLDCPGHYMRRIKNVSLSIPAIAGPYTSINCSLALGRSTIRRFTEGEYERNLNAGPDDRFIDFPGPSQPIVTSSAQNDAGIFEVNFRDERYLPFEGLGVDSTWTLELPSELRQFDYNTITDVVLHLRYTARPGDDDFRRKATGSIKAAVLANAGKPLMERLFSMKRDFPDTWYRFEAGEGNFIANFEKEHFGYLAQAFQLNIDPNLIQLYSIKAGVLHPIAMDGVVFDLDQINVLKKGTIEFPRAAIDLEAEEVFFVVRYGLGA